MSPAAVLSASAFCSGVLAAWFWYRASQVRFPPFTEVRLVKGEPAPMTDREFMRWSAKWIHSLGREFGESGRLNKHAAIWTAVSTLLSGAASGLALWPN